MRRFLPSYAVAASCPGDFLRLHGRIAPSVSMVREFQTSGVEEEG
jgi:hypothetical protein